jgi:collagenase-like PrtC family protease
MKVNTNISDEELENYLDFLNESEQDTVTVNINFLLELAREVFFYHGMAEEQADLKKSNQGISR